ncbi:unnamed protein product [Cylicostephanus goldi]|uniref:Uncharacterized protein n=1 Tax=Cylicostephanus goldi TaxID=71465 RepID=A0A3P6T6P0_CYLGO|nr:unnamed protein product [Cylicostephanus goldi]
MKEFREGVNRKISYNERSIISDILRLPTLLDLTYFLVIIKQMTMFLHWRQIKNITDVENIADLPEHIQKLPEHVGIFSFSCRMPGAEGSEEFDFDYCKDWWNNLKTWEKVVTVAMVVAAVVELFALVWDVLSALACCCKSALLTPLTLAAFCATVALAVAVGVYGYKNKEAFEGVKDLDDIKSKLDSEASCFFRVSTYQ